MIRAIVRAAAFVLALVFGCAAASAHPAVPSAAELSIDRDGAVTVKVIHDAIAMALNEEPRNLEDEYVKSILNGPRDALVWRLDDARRRLLADVRVLVDGRPVALELPEYVPPDELLRGMLSPTGSLIAHRSVAVMRGRFASGKLLTLRLPECLTQVAVTVGRPGREGEPFALPAGHTSEPIDVSFVGAEHPQTPEPIRSGFVSFMVMGYEHILPDGWDHVVFVLGLFFASATLRQLLVQVTVFTLAHCVTLALGVTGTLVIDPSIVEPAIAASIVLVAVENIAVRRATNWRLALIFLFGLVHGLGLAEQLRANIPVDTSITMPLVAFNLGVEAGQLSVLCIAALAVGWWRSRPWYRSCIAVPISVAIGGLGMWWLVERLL